MQETETRFIDSVICHQYKKQISLIKLGQAVEQGFLELRAGIPCKGVYQSNPCKEVNNQMSRCVLRYYCELKILENA